MLAPENAKILKYGYAQSNLTETLGFLSYRLLLLSVCQPKKKMRSGRHVTRNDVRELFERRVYEEYVRTENLAGDLFALLKCYEDRLTLRCPLTTPEDLLALTPKTNISKKIEGLTAAAVPADLRALVRQREWLLYEAFGYEKDSKGAPPHCVTAGSNEYLRPIWSLREIRKYKRKKRLVKGLDIGFGTAMPSAEFDQQLLAGEG
ncbi:MAG: hypothetical protein WDM89_13950 [Rhizomicrobium sp.]